MRGSWADDGNIIRSRAQAIAADAELQLAADGQVQESAVLAAIGVDRDGRLADHKGKMRPAERMAGDVRLERGGIRDGAPVPGPDSASHFLGLAERDGAQ